MTTTRPDVKAWGGHSLYMDQMDVVRGRIWDCIHFGPGATITRTNSRFFSNVGIPSNKSRGMTNMDLSQRLPAPDMFLIEKVILAFGSETAPEESSLLSEMAMFDFWLGSKTYIRAPIISLPRMGNAQSKAPLKVCNSCQTVSLDLKCRSCGSPEWKYLSHAGDEAPQTGDMDGIKYMIDLAGGNVAIVNGMSFYAELDMEQMTLKNVYEGGKGLKLWAILEGWHARAIQ